MSTGDPTSERPAEKFQRRREWCATVSLKLLRPCRRMTLQPGIYSDRFCFKCWSHYLYFYMQMCLFTVDFRAHGIASLYPQYIYVYVMIWLYIHVLCNMCVSNYVTTFIASLHPMTDTFFHKVITCTSCLFRDSIHILNFYTCFFFIWHDSNEKLGVTPRKQMNIAMPLRAFWSLLHRGIILR